jgi:hypothetical protein
METFGSLSHSQMPVTGSPEPYSIFLLNMIGTYMYNLALRQIRKTIFATKVGRDSVDGIATRYRLDGPGIESWWGRDFPYLSRPALGLNHSPVQWAPALSRG